MADVRKSHRRIGAGEWKALIGAIDAVRAPGAGQPRYQDFVKVHVDAMEGPGMHTWGVHSMAGMRGRNFLAWHRWYLRAFELRLRQEDSSVTIPYWDWVTDPKIPSQVNRQAQLSRWQITRQPDKSYMPDRGDYTKVMRREKFGPFQLRLEGIHNDVHVAVGGEMSTARSPADPLFWLHHANVDRIWARWQERNPAKRPTNVDEELKPAPMFGIRVSETLKLGQLGYRYA